MVFVCSSFLPFQLNSKIKDQTPMVRGRGMTDEMRQKRINQNLLRQEGTGWDVGYGGLHNCTDVLFAQNRFDIGFSDPLPCVARGTLDYGGHISG
jgi:hypothetical protein